MIEGSLGNVPLTDVFQVIVTSQKSGVLTIGRGRSRARVHFAQGRIQYAHISPGVNLGEILVRMELLTVAEMLDLLLKQPRESAGLPLALAAVSAGYLDESDLHLALERQVFEVLTELLGWQVGNFSFGENSDRATQFPVEHSFDAMSLLMQVAQQLTDFEEGAVKPGAVYRQAGDPTKVEMPASGWEALATVDGRRTAASIAAELELPERQVYHVLHKLERLGVVEPSPFQVESPQVLLLTPSNAHARLLRLLLLRCRTLPRIESDPQACLSFLAENHPRALVVDDHDGSSWQFLREVRRLPGKSHLPVVVLTSPGPDTRGLAKMRRPRALTLAKPFAELEFQQLLTRMVGTATT
jgi:CheY-like chemotaxis protein